MRGFLGNKTPLPRFSTPLSSAAIRYVAFGPNASPAQVAFYERMLVSCPPGVRADIGIAMSDMDLHHALPHLTVPTIVIAGAVDRLTPPSHARRIAEMLPELDRLDRAGKRRPHDAARAAGRGDRRPGRAGRARRPTAAWPEA